jgi:methylphosphotriester-DNA--protein-cysteine methyltransferase
MPVHFISNGHRVPLDLMEASMERLATYFLADELPRTAADHAQRLDRYFEPSVDSGSHVYLANKNSDVFHRAECKWIRLINRSNIVEFNSFAEALNNRFKPCRYCNPQHLSITGMLQQERSAL